MNRLHDMFAIVLSIIFITIAYLIHPFSLILIGISGSLLVIILLPWFHGSLTERLIKGIKISFILSSLLFISGYWFEAWRTYVLYK